MVIYAGIIAQRFGYGTKKGVLPRGGAADLLAGPDTIYAKYPGEGSAAALERKLSQMEELRSLRDIATADRADRRKAILRTTGQRINTNLRLELARLVDADDSFRERLVQFWADHFTTANRSTIERPRRSAYVDDVIRPHVTGRFGSMLKAAILHPLMIEYLDQVSSIGPNSAFGLRRQRGVNENLARELLELHTIGVKGRYSQDDVRQAALLLTGLTTTREGQLTFLVARAEPGAETVLGRTYGGNSEKLAHIEKFLDDLAVHHMTARHMAEKLATHFVSDDPPEELVAALALIWEQTKGDLRAVSTALAQHPAAYDPTFVKARQPFEFVVASLRALGITGEKIMEWKDPLLRQTVLLPLRAMGQEWQVPQGPDGWEEGFDDWITPQGLATRIGWAMRIPSRLVKPLPDAREFVDHALAGVADDHLRAMVARAETNAEGIGIVLASPQFNRR